MSIFFYEIRVFPFCFLGIMGTLCQILAFLSFIYCGLCQESSTTPKTSPPTTTLDTFLSSKDDFINIQVKRFFKC